MPPVGGNGELFIDTWLTNLSFDYLQNPHVSLANRVFPVVPVRKESGRFIVFERAWYLRDQMRERPLGGEADVIDWDKRDDFYRVVERAVAHKIDDRQRANADDQLDLDRQAMRLLTRTAAINNDRRWADTFFRPDVWDIALDGDTSDFTHFDATGSRPVELFREIADNIAKTGVGPGNLVMVVGPKANRSLLSNDDIIERIKYTQRGVPSEDLLASLFGVDEYLVARHIFTASNEPAQVEGIDDIDYIIDEDSILVVYRAPSPGLETASAGYTFAWTGLLGGAANTMGGVMLRGREEKSFSDYFVLRTANDQKLVATDLGVFLENCSA